MILNVTPINDVTSTYEGKILKKKVGVNIAL